MKSYTFFATIVKKIYSLRSLFLKTPHRKDKENKGSNKFSKSLLLSLIKLILRTRDKIKFDVLY
jgi:hypothetical protein